MDFATFETINRKKAQYCRCLDTRDWAGFVAIALPEARYSFRDDGGGFDSPKAFAERLSASFGGVRSSHRVNNPELAFTGPDEVSATWAMNDEQRFPPGPDGKARFLHGYGHYHEVWQRKGGDWFLAELVLRRTLVESGEA